MIAVHDLVKEYGKFRAVDNVTLDVKPGEIHGFLGPNGAGKTTTMRMIAGLLKPSSGRILVDNHDLETEAEAAKAALGFIPDRPFIYDKLTAGEFLRFHAGLYGMSNGMVEGRVHEMLDLFELRQWEHELVESFSHGMKQRLVMSSAFFHRPRAVAVDEPMVGLDPRGARLIKDVFRRMGGGVEMPGIDVVVFSQTLPPSAYPGVRITNHDPGEIVAQLKAKPGKDIWLFGGGELFRTLLDAGLVDSVELAVMPVLLGNGIPLLPPGASTKLVLVDQKTLPRSGIVVMSYTVPGASGPAPPIRFVKSKSRASKKKTPPKKTKKLSRRPAKSRRRRA